MKQTFRKAIHALSMTALLIAVVLGNFQNTFAQFTFTGDYDKTFAAPLGYYIDPEDPIPTIDDFSTVFVGGALLPDGSIIAGGRHVDVTSRGAFYLRKFTPTGAVDSAFGLNGVARAVFYTGVAVSGGQLFPSNDTPWVLRVQPDGKILVAGQCTISSPAVGAPNGIPTFDTDACVMRFNPDGSVDDSFGNVMVTTGNTNKTFSFAVGGGRFITQTGVIIATPEPKRGTNGRFIDMDIQPDGKIVLVGETRNEYNNGNVFAQAAFIMRLNQNGTRDNSFGNFGISQMAGTQAFPNCYRNTGFQGIRVQADGRIIAVGYSALTNDTCQQANRFIVTRWSANGSLETTLQLGSSTTFSGQHERATTTFFTRDGGKILVSGSYDCQAVMVRFNVADLSVDTSFGTNGIRGYSPTCANGGSAGTTLHIRAIQPDGKIIGIDEGTLFPQGNVVRFNPDGTPDQSFGNAVMFANQTGRGRLNTAVTIFTGQTSPLVAANVLVRPNGRINLVGSSPINFAASQYRAAVSQQNTLLKNGVYTDFENDGKDNLAVYRPSDGFWHNLDSRNNNYTAVQWGISTDKLAPADYDGDGKTDHAVFRDGVWYIYQSLNGQVRIISFGLAGDLPRPGDFDGDGLADVSVFRPSNGVWYRIDSSNGQFAAVQFGANGDVPMLGDYDADGKTDFAVFRPSNAVWYILRSSDNQVRIDAFGLNGDIPLNGDFNGDSKSDLVVFRPSDRTWYIAHPTGVPGQNFDAVPFGLATDVPVAADYDNDGKTDIAIYRNGIWWINRSGTNDVITAQFGLSDDKPIPAAYLP